MSAVVLDTGIPASVFELVYNAYANELNKYVEGIKNIVGAIKQKKVYVGFSVFKPADLGFLEKLREVDFGADIMPIFTFDNLVVPSPNSCAQVDVDGDVAGSICPTRGIQWFKRLVEGLKWRSVGVDVTDMYEFSAESGNVSCLCETCRREIGKIIGRKALSVIKKLGIRRIALSTVRSRDEEGYSPFPFKYLKENKMSIDKLAAYRFFAARSVVTARFLKEALSGVEGYRAVFAQGISIEYATAPVAKILVKELEGSGIVVFSNSQMPCRSGIGVYNLRRGRYMINKISLALWLMGEELREGLKSPPFRRVRALEAWDDLIRAVNTSWTPSVEELDEGECDYAVFGMPPQRELLKFVIDKMLEVEPEKEDAREKVGIKELEKLVKKARSGWFGFNQLK